MWLPILLLRKIRIWQTRRTQYLKPGALPFLRDNLWCYNKKKGMTDEVFRACMSCLKSWGFFRACYFIINLLENRGNSATLGPQWGKRNINWMSLLSITLSIKRKAGPLAPQQAVTRLCPRTLTMKELPLSLSPKVGLGGVWRWAVGIFTVQNCLKQPQEGSLSSREWRLQCRRHLIVPQNCLE